MITKARAFEIAAQWVNYISAADVGLPFVSFCGNDATPGSPAHQEACIRYTIELLAKEGLDHVDRSDLIALLYFFDQTVPNDNPGEDLWSN